MEDWAYLFDEVHVDGPKQSWYMTWKSYRKQRFHQAPECLLDTLEEKVYEIKRKPIDPTKPMTAVVIHSHRPACVNYVI